MFEIILVPLDGSKAAEAALPTAEYMARAFGSSLILFHALEKNPPNEVHGEAHLSSPSEAENYLAALAAKASAPKGTSAHVHIEQTSDVAASIADHMRELNPDLVVMCSHGGSPLARTVVGDLAVKVIGKGSVPVLLLRSEWKSLAQPIFKKVIVALDQKSIHDRAIEQAVAVTEALRADLELLTVVPTFGTLKGKEGASGLLLPGTARIALELEEQAMREHLKEYFSKLDERGLAVEFRIARGDPAKKIVSTAKKAGDCLVVVGTHGKSGMNAFWAGSVMAKVAAATEKPLLLVPVKE